MEIELYYADQLVPTSELFRALQSGTIDAVQSDDATMASPVDISVFGGYFPFSTRYSLDLPVLFQRSASTRSGRRPMTRSRASSGSAPAPGTPATSSPRSRSARWPT